MSSSEEIFRVTDRWGDLIVLTREDWEGIAAKRPGVEGYVDHVRQTLEQPSMVFEGRYADSKVFFRASGAGEASPCRALTRSSGHDLCD